MPFSLFLALKYLKPKRSVTSVITCVSVIGVLLGVAVVIIVRAVMTGFGDLWEEKILDFKPHATLRSLGPGPVIHGEEELARKISRIPGVTAVSPEINLLGQTVDEAIASLDKYLDDAYLAHLDQVRIVHGKGTGALRSGVHDYLRKQKRIKSYRLGEFGEGDSGVTIAVFR